jgi:hypothetical protein
MTKEIEVVFAPGCFDDFDGTQEELDELIAEIRQMVKDGSFMDNSVPVDERDEEEIMDILIAQENRNTQ